MVPVRKFPSSQTFRMLLQPSFTNSCRKGAGKAPQGPQLSTLKWKYSKQEQKAMNKHKLSHNTVKMVPHRAPSLQNKRYHVLINAIYIYVYICIYTYTYTHIHTHIYIYITYRPNPKISLSTMSISDYGWQISISAWNQISLEPSLRGEFSWMAPRRQNCRMQLGK